MNLLPLAAEPFVAPTDRDMLPSERREFVRTHRTCVFGYARRADGPSMSIVYYIPTDDDELLISTMGGRAKAKAVARSGKVSLCILDERWPFAYLQVYCDATGRYRPRSRRRRDDGGRRTDVGAAAPGGSASGGCGDGEGRGPGRDSLPSLFDVRPATAAPAPKRPGGDDHPLDHGRDAVGRARRRTPAAAPAAGRPNSLSR